MTGLRLHSTGRRLARRWRRHSDDANRSDGCRLRDTMQGCEMTKACRDIHREETESSEV